MDIFGFTSILLFSILDFLFILFCPIFFFNLVFWIKKFYFPFYSFCLRFIGVPQSMKGSISFINSGKISAMIYFNIASLLFSPFGNLARCKLNLLTLSSVSFFFFFFYLSLLFFHLIVSLCLILCNFFTSSFQFTGLSLADSICYLLCHTEFLI